jgi:hypothetical protein
MYVPLSLQLQVTLYAAVKKRGHCITVHQWLENGVMSGRLCLPHASIADRIDSIRK